jgi:hypothetical protein
MFVGNMQWLIQILHYIFLIIFLLFWVLLMVSRAKTHRTAPSEHIPVWQIGEVLSMGGSQVIYEKPDRGP